MKIERTALIMHPAMEMYRLVHDVPSYPGFLRWCTFAQVHEQSDEYQLASLGIKIAGIEQRFMTRNQLVPGERLGLSLVEGPFRSLSGEWRFKALGERGSKISLELRFDFLPGLISTAFQRGFRNIADHLVQEFCLRADELYGANRGEKPVVS
jgi:ribosome-associated toxin RatA of RatAB toxin-antitoxin module